mmetsp:Transcript_26100/g.83310  ORF Transcript_26100/g.83310 Transcript_26100/m.83310 type:complete len:926 (-) Transcript_26100:225-3002(-)
MDEFGRETGVMQLSTTCVLNNEQSVEDFDKRCKRYDKDVCGIEYSNDENAFFCPIENPARYPLLLKVPKDGVRVEPTTGDEIPRKRIAPRYASAFFDGVDGRPAPGALWADGQLPMLYTGENKVLADSLAAGLWEGNLVRLTSQGVENFMERAGLATEKLGPQSSYVDPAFFEPIGVLVDAGSCAAGGTAAAAAGAFSDLAPAGLQCEEDPRIFLEDKDNINYLIFCGFEKARCTDMETPRNLFYSAAWDFRATSATKLMYDVWIADPENIGDDDDGGRGGGPSPPLRGVEASINMVADSYLRAFLGSEYGIKLTAFAATPKPGTELRLDFASLIGPLFFSWVIQFMLPVILVSLVYEKHHRLRIMMKMQGLGDLPYWLVTYGWFFLLYVVYIILLVGLGSGIGLNFFTLTDYGLQLVFFLLYGNVQIAMCFLLSSFFNSPKTATVVAFLWVFGSGLLCDFVLEIFIVKDKWYMVLLEMVPAVGLYRGLYEMAQYSFQGAYSNSKGLTWGKLGDPNNHYDRVMIIFLFEWIIFSALAWYIEQVVDDRTGVRRHPLFFLGKGFGRSKEEASGAAEEKEPEDVAQERARVEATMSGGGSGELSIVLHNVSKIYPALDGAPAKRACKSLSLQIPRGECFGLLGPNGAGKSTAINMMVGFLESDSGTILIEGTNINDDIDSVYAMMGVCPQHDLQWENLTGREHLNFYGRLKSLKGPALSSAVEAALKSVNLWNGGVGDKKSGEYSGGMRRRLSVAISLIGNPLVVYLDEPSTGLDPASRRSLWAAVKAAKKDRALILTTHSMEEAEVLCDRIGIFVDGAMQCVDHPAALRAKHGGYLVFTITTAPEAEGKAAAFIKKMAPGAKLTYSLAGSQKYEFPADMILLSSVFSAVNELKRSVDVVDWGCYHATMEEVFIKFSKSKGVEASGLH